MSDVYIIAEMSANHGGSLDRALEIVHAAKKAGADCLKIQTYTPDSMTIDCDGELFRVKDGLWKGSYLYKLYGEAATPYEWQKRIKEECDKINIDFLSTPFDKNGADFLESLGVSAYKIASFELTDIPLIKHVAAKGKPLFLSTGMGTEEEIEEAVDAVTESGLGKDKITLMKCTSEYPARTSDMNLLTIPDMIRRFGVNAGFSDHSTGILAPVAAVALGAVAVEKHFCLSRKIKTPDSEFSSEPHEFAEMASAARETYAARGGVLYGVTERERESTVFRRSIFAVLDISEGEMFTRDNIRIIRPGYGMKPKFYESLLGKAAGRGYKRGEPLREERYD